MTGMLWALVGAVVGLLLGGLITYIWFQRAIERQRSATESAQAEAAVLRTRCEEISLQKQRAEAALEAATAQVEAARAELTQHQLDAQRQESALIQQFTEEKARLEARMAAQHREVSLLQEQLRNQQEMLRNFEETARKTFENLAHKILEEKGEKFSRQSRVQLEQLLNPLKEQIKDFRQQVEQTDKAQHGRIAALREQLQRLHETSHRLSEEALALTRALKGQSQTRGAWGEMILESILEHSGLIKGQEYQVQPAMQSEDGRRLRPDVVIHLPEGRRLVVDAKVSLVDYERYVNAASEDERSRALQGFLRSVRQHVRDLRARNYQDLFKGQSPDFVLMFMPLEPAFSLALQEDARLYQEAFEQRIVIVSPTTLLAVLRIVHSMWQNEKQRRNALKIAEEAGKLYDKFVSLYESLDDMGKRIDQLGEAHEKAMKQLKEGRGNLISKVESLKKLGAKARKQLPAAETDETLPPDDVM